MQMGDSERISKLVGDTVLMLCKNSIHFSSELKVKGLVGVISDATNIFLVEINETFGCTNDGEVNTGASDTPGKVPTRRKLDMTTMPPPRKMMALMAPPACGASSIMAQDHSIQHLTKEQLALVRSSPAKGAATSLQTVSAAMTSQPRMLRPVLALPTSAQLNAKNFALVQRRPMTARMQMSNSSFRGRAPGAAMRGQAVRKPSLGLLAGRQIRTTAIPRQALANRARMRGNSTLRAAGVRGMRQGQPVKRVVKKMNPRLAPGNLGSQIVMPSPQSMASSPMVKRGVLQSPGNQRQRMMAGLRGIRSDVAGFQNQSPRMLMSPGQSIQKLDSHMQIAIAQPPRYSQSLALTSPQMGNPPQSALTPTNKRSEGCGRMQLATMPSPRYSQSLALPSPQMGNPPRQSPVTATTQRMQGRGRMQLATKPSPRYSQSLALPSPQMFSPPLQSSVTPTTQRMEGRGRMQLAAMPSPQYSQSLALPSPQMGNPPIQSPVTPMTQRMEGRGQMQLAVMPSPRYSQSLALPSPQMGSPPQSPLTPTTQRMEGRARMQLASMPSPRMPPVCLQSGIVPFHGNKLSLFAPTSTPATMQPTQTGKHETSTAVLSPKRLLVICPSQGFPPIASTQPGMLPLSSQVTGTCGSDGENRFMNTSSKPLLTATLQYSSGSGISLPAAMMSPTMGKQSIQAKLVSTSSQANTEKLPVHGTAGPTQGFASPTRMACIQRQTSSAVGSDLQAGSLLSVGPFTGSVSSSSVVSLQTVGMTNPQAPGTTLPRLIAARSMSGEMVQHGTVAGLRSSQQSLLASDHMSSPFKRQDSTVQSFVLSGALNSPRMLGNQSTQQTVSTAAAAQQSASASPLVTDAQVDSSRFAQFFVGSPVANRAVKVEVDAVGQLVGEVVNSPARTQSQQMMQSPHQSHGQQPQHGQNVQVKHIQQQGSHGQQPLHGQNQQQQLMHVQQQGSHGQQPQHGQNVQVKHIQQQGSHGQNQQQLMHVQQQGSHGQQPLHGQNQQQLTHVQQQGSHGQNQQQLMHVQQQGSHGQQPLHGQNQQQLMHSQHQLLQGSHGQQVQQVINSPLQPRQGTPGKGQSQQDRYGQQQQMSTLGQQILVSSHSQQPQMSTHGQQIQVSSDGQQPQLSTHGQQIQVSLPGHHPQASTMDQPRPLLTHHGQQHLHHPPNNSSPVVIRDLQTRSDNVLTSQGQQELRGSIVLSHSRTNLQQPSSATHNLSQSENRLTTTVGQQSVKSQVHHQQTFPGWQTQAAQKSLHLQPGTQAWQKSDSMARSQQYQQQVAQQQASSVTKDDQISSVPSQPVMQNRLASPYNPVMQNQSKNLQQSSVEPRPEYHGVHVGQLGLPSGQSGRTSTASNLSYDQGQLQPSDQTLVPLPVAVVSACKIFQPAQSLFSGQTSVAQAGKCTAVASNPLVSKEKPKIEQTVTSIPILPADLNRSTVNQPDNQQPAAQNLKTFIQTILDSQPDRLPFQHGSPLSQSSTTTDAHYSLRNHQDSSLASQFPVLPSYESSLSRSGWNTPQKKKLDREALDRSDEDHGLQGLSDEFDLDAFAFSQVQKLVELKQMEMEKSVEVASSTSSGQMERTLKSSGSRLENSETGMTSQSNLEEPAEEEPTASLADLIKLSYEKTMVATGCKTAAEDSGDREGLVDSPISPSETIAYSEGGSPLRLEESELDDLEENLTNFTEPFMLFSNEKMSRFHCLSVGCRFTINNEADLASHYTHVHSDDINKEPVDADSRYLPLLEPARLDDTAPSTPGISCPFPGCLRAFSKISGVYNHHQKAHKIGLTKRQKRALSSKYGLIYHCEVCLRDFLSKSDLLHHMTKTRHGK